MILDIKQCNAQSSFAYQNMALLEVFFCWLVDFLRY